MGRRLMLSRYPGGDPGEACRPGDGPGQPATSTRDREDDGLVAVCPSLGRTTCQCQTTWRADGRLITSQSSWSLSTTAARADSFAVRAKVLRRGVVWTKLQKSGQQPSGIATKRLYLAIYTVSEISLDISQRNWNRFRRDA